MACGIVRVRLVQHFPPPHLPTHCNVCHNCCCCCSDFAPVGHQGDGLPVESLPQSTPSFVDWGIEALCTRLSILDAFSAQPRAVGPGFEPGYCTGRRRCCPSRSAPSMQVLQALPVRHLVSVYKHPRTTWSGWMLAVVQLQVPAVLTPARSHRAQQWQR